ncbi:hypothetical protein HNR23_000705 [Nocardiopsis mwathae]|uniref:Uncharacterized protein n=1 Tax=Nocardiopsis mwathae TaxID=1472723 RepID=A0A7X0D431_9ACTN|nr:hypothetical protein [Nocardiopsis mwathae]MBB6170645.1 hypothetical protein [Nocardiopsis mwathae]
MNGSRGSLVSTLATVCGLFFLVSSCSWASEEEILEESDISVISFEEFAQLDLPDSAEDVTTNTLANELDSLIYRAHFTTTHEEAEDICREIGNYLPRSQGIPKHDQGLYGITPDTAREFEDSAYGCTALNQQTGRQVEGIVLYPDGAAAHVYLRAYELGR